VKRQCLRCDKALALFGQLCAEKDRHHDGKMLLTPMRAYPDQATDHGGMLALRRSHSAVNAPGNFAAALTRRIRVDAMHAAQSNCRVEVRYLALTAGR
jgi:hypothetical protein